MFDIPSSRVRQYDSTGQQTTPAQLQESGFDIGVNVMRKKCKTMGVIKSMTSTKVQVELDETKSVQVFDATTFLQGEWRTVKPKVEIILVENWGTYECHQAREIAIMELQAEATSALCEAVRSSKSLMGILDLVAKPTRDVRALKPIAKNQLSLVPATTKVLVLPKGKTPPVGSLSMGQKALTKTEEFEIWLVPHMVMPKDGVMPKGSSMIVPCWLVRGTEKKDEVNLEVFPDLTGRKIEKNKALRVPVLRNSIKIKEGESLMLFRPKAEDTAEDHLDHPPAKKAKK